MLYFTNSVLNNHKNGPLVVILVFLIVTTTTFQPISSKSIPKLPFQNETDTKSNDTRKNGAGAPEPLPVPADQPGAGITLIQPSQNSSHPGKPGDGSNTGTGAGGLASTGGGNTADHDSTAAVPEGFDDKAIQRAFIVLAGLGLLLISYFGIKFVCIKKRRVPGAAGAGGSGGPTTTSAGRRGRGSNSSSSSGRYGLLESTEMDLLGSIDEEDDDEDEQDQDQRDRDYYDSDEAESNTLFDLRSHRHT